MATMTDIARRAGVALSTVSYALSGARPVSDETRRRVQQAMQELGYQPHALARGLASKRSRLLALLEPLVYDRHAPGGNEFFYGASHAAHLLGYTLVLPGLDSNNLDALRAFVQTGLADGIVLTDVHLADPRVALLNELGVPFSLIGRCAANDGHPFVDVDFAQAGALVVDHLVDLGHQHLAFLNFSADVIAEGYGPAVRLEESFLAAASQRRVTAMAAPCETTAEAGYRALQTLLAAQPAPSALVTHNIAALPGVLRALREDGRHMPDDFALVAVALAAHTAALMSPAATGVEWPGVEMGRIAVEILAQRIAAADAPPRHCLLAARLVVRETTAARRGKEVPIERAS